jgi:hypothetical protein
LISSSILTVSPSTAINFADMANSLHGIVCPIFHKMTLLKGPTR